MRCRRWLILARLVACAFDVDFFGGNALPGGYLFWGGRQSTYNLRGETSALGTGFVYEYDRSKAKSCLLRAYYYTRLSVVVKSKSGADITWWRVNYRDADYRQIMVADSDIGRLPRQTYRLR